MTMAQDLRRFVLVIAACLASGHPSLASGPAAASPQPGTALETLASPPHGLIRTRAQHFYRMPDGRIWDGYYAREFRLMLDRNLRLYDRRERGQPAPGATIVEDRIVGTVWRFREHRDTQAWGVFELLAKEDGELDRPGRRVRGELSPPYLETADRRRWKDVPPLWSSRDSTDFDWDFTLIDENSPDTYTRRTHGNYLRITRMWGDGQYEVEGYSLDLGTIEGIVTIPETQRPQQFVQRDRFRGTFFLWPEGSTDEPGGFSRPAWRYIPADELRISPEELAEALIEGRADIIEWNYARINNRLIWQRTVRPVEFVPVRIISDRPVDAAPPPVGQEGPDLIMLKDGRWYRGRLIRQDEQTVVFATKIGGMESELVFAAEDISELQSPEKAGPPPG